MRNRLRLITLLSVFLLLFSFQSTEVSAKETEFEFYYQNIEKVVQINNPEPKGWWENAKHWVKKGINAVKKGWEQNITRRYFPGEGTKRWYSKKDSNIAYDVKRTLVKSEEHLLSLMGAENKDELSDGQKALLASYQHSKSEAIQGRTKYGYQTKLKVILSDTTGFDNSKDYPSVRKDFWPYSHGNLIQMSSGRYNYPGSDEDAKSTFVHEFAHSLDRTIKEIIHPYGKDGSHYANEMSKPRAAFVEGWAEFNEMLDSEYEAKLMKSTIKKVKIEDKKEAGKYTNIKADDPSLSGADLLNVEGINAMTLYRMSQEIPNGKEKIFEAFKSSRWKIFRTLKTFTKTFAKKYPEDAEKIAQILDEETHSKLSDEKLQKYLGNSKGAQAYIAKRNEEPTEEQPEATSTEVASTAEYTDGQNSQPSSFVNSDTIDANSGLAAAYKTYLNAKQNYQDSIKSAEDSTQIREFGLELQKAKQVYEKLLKK